MTALRHYQITSHLRIYPMTEKSAVRSRADVSFDRSGYRAIGCFGKLDICARVPNIPLVQNRIHRMRQRLIDAAAGHYIAAEKKLHCNVILNEVKDPATSSSITQPTIAQSMIHCEIPRLRSG